MRAKSVRSPSTNAVSNSLCELEKSSHFSVLYSFPDYMQKIYWNSSIPDK